MPSQLRFRPLLASDVNELAEVLLNRAVYEHIEGGLPSLEDFRLDLETAIAGPGPRNRDEQRLNYLVHDGHGSPLGRLEATVHHGIAEVAFLFGPAHWGKGYATGALQWLHQEVVRTCGVTVFWATTEPANQRCQALLRRCGYVQSPGASVRLYSCAPRDLLFRFEPDGTPLDPTQRSAPARGSARSAP
jgi:RimJ/RimL family protein N-acetyltransferase